MLVGVCVGGGGVCDSVLGGSVCWGECVAVCWGGVCVGGVCWGECVAVCWGECVLGVCVGGECVLGGGVMWFKELN